MRLGDGTDLLGVNDPRSASIGIIRVDPTDVRQDVLTAILAQDELHREQIAIVLHEQNKAFQRPVDFDGLKDMRRTLKADLVIVARAGSSSAEFARQRRFPVYSSLESFANSMLAEEPAQDSKRGWFGRKQKVGAPTEAAEMRQPLPVLLPDPEEENVAQFAIPPQAGASMKDEEEDIPTQTFPNAGIAAVGATYLDHTDEDELAPPPMKPVANGMNRNPGEVEKTASTSPVAGSNEPRIIELRKTTKPLDAIAPTAGAAGAASIAAAPASKPMKGGNMQRRRVAPVGTMLAAGGLGAAAFAANATQTGGAPPGGGVTGAQGGGGGGGGRRRRSRRLLALLLVLLTVLLLAGIAFASPPGQQVLKNILPGPTTTATVTITPVSQDVNDTFVITAITGTPDIAKRQVQARIISVTSASASASAHATGPIPGQQATGTLTFINTNLQSVTISGGILTGKSGVAISFSGFTVPAGSATTRGIAVNQGTSGNIPALDIAGSCCASGILVRNFTAFSGGVNPQPNKVITSNDIATASNNLINTVKPQAQSQLAALVKSTESVVPNSLSCKTNVSANHKAGDVASTVTVTGTATCSEEVYDKAGALKLAANLLTMQAAQKPGPGYAPAQNKIVTGVTGVTVIDSNQTVSLLVSADGIWVYQFSAQLKQQLAAAIANKGESAAITYLKAQTGVRDVSISISGGATTLPGATAITIIITSVNGPTATPTLTVGSPTPTTNPGSTPTPSPTPQNGQGGS
jgi:hypothetical protein